MRRVVLDTNIFISAFLTDGPPRRVLQKAVEERILLAVSPAILDELSQVLRRKKFRIPAIIIDSYLNEISRLAVLVSPARGRTIIKADPADDRILECTDAFEADYLVSGDVHLLEIGHHGRTRILKAREFLELDDDD